MNVIATYTTRNGDTLILVAADRGRSTILQPKVP